MSSEHMLDADGWRAEAQAVIKDVKCSVKEIKISEVLPNSNQHIFLNITTLEMKSLCVELTGHGFRVVGRLYDNQQEHTGVYYETPYSLLNAESPMFCQSFGLQLQDKLQMLLERQEQK